MATTDIPDENAEPVASETTALLASPGRAPSSHAQENGTAKDDAEDKPLPKQQIFFLCVARLVEPIAFFCIFPFINQMIWDTGAVAETDVGFYSGLIVSHRVRHAACLMPSRNLYSQ